MKICPICQKEYPPTNNKQVYCTPTCQRKGPHNQAKVKRRIEKLKIARAIRDEALGLPTKGSKMVWDGIGKWARDYDFCEECGGTIYRYFSNGLCTYCYNRLRQRTPEQLAKFGASSKEKRKEAADWLQRAQNGQVEKTPTINNLLANLERLKL